MNFTKDTKGTKFFYFIICTIYQGEHFLIYYSIWLTAPPILIAWSFVSEDRSYWGKYANLKRYWILVYLEKNWVSKNGIAFFLGAIHKS